MKETEKEKQIRLRQVIKKLKSIYPDAKCALLYDDAWQLLVATMLSAQCTDKRVNLVTPELFKQLPRMKDFVNADLSRIENLIRSTGFFKNKAKNIKAAAQILLERHEGRVPSTLQELIALPGVGRKTANVVLGNYYEIPGLTVDTHMLRVNRRLGFSVSDDAVKVEFQLMPLVPKQDWVVYTHLIIQHGRACCVARTPHCSICAVNKLCPKIGVSKAI